MDQEKKRQRYERILEQLNGLLSKSDDPDARMATIIALLHHKMDYFFWTGFYFLNRGELVVKSYQGPVACQVLEKNKGVCWASVNAGKSIIVPDVHKFPGHIACDSRSNSEIVIPVYDPAGKITGVLDVDSTAFGSFDETDELFLSRITGMIHPPK
jgi:L-methionine (R)-S-oxide reductase